MFEGGRMSIDSLILS